MITEVVVLLVVVVLVGFWGVRSIVRSVRGRCCGGSKADEQAKCGECPSAVKSECQEDDSCAGRGLTGDGG